MRHPLGVRTLLAGPAAATLLALPLLGGCEHLPVPERQPVILGETDPADAEWAARQRLMADPRVGLAPMDAESRAQLGGFFARPNPKAFAFSPERGTNRHTW